MRLIIDGTDVDIKHKLMTKQLISSIEAVAPKAKNILEAEIRRDLTRKILRPYEYYAKAGLDARKKPQERRLIKNINGTVEKRGGDTVIGVGNIEEMNESVPYWRIQDRGGPVTAPVVPGYWVDGAGARIAGDPGRMPSFGSPSGDSFIYDPNAPTVMFVKSRIRPKRYFAGGERLARPRVIRQFRQAFERVWR